MEFALIGPMLLLIVAGTADYGLYINKRMQLQELSRRAAEYVVQGGLESDVEANVIQTSALFTQSDVNQKSIAYTGAVVCECAGGAETACAGSCHGNDYLRSFYTATVTATYTPIVPWPGIASSITLTGYSRLQYAR